jgi:predicted RND superfamily exporter protein
VVYRGLAKLYFQEVDFTMQKLLKPQIYSHTAVALLYVTVAVCWSLDIAGFRNKSMTVLEVVGWFAVALVGVSYGLLFLKCFSRDYSNDNPKENDKNA